MHHLNLTFHTHYAAIRFYLSGRVTEEIEKQNGHRRGGVAWTAQFSKYRKKKFEEIEKKLLAYFRMVLISAICFDKK